MEKLEILKKEDWERREEIDGVLYIGKELERGVTNLNFRAYKQNFKAILDFAENATEEEREEIAKLLEEEKAFVKKLEKVFEELRILISEEEQKIEHARGKLGKKERYLWAESVKETL